MTLVSVTGFTQHAVWTSDLEKFSDWWEANCRSRTYLGTDFFGRARFSDRTGIYYMKDTLEECLSIQASNFRGNNREIGKIEYIDQDGKLYEIVIKVK